MLVAPQNLGKGSLAPERLHMNYSPSGIGSDSGIGLSYTSATALKSLVPVSLNQLVVVVSHKYSILVDVVASHLVSKVGA